jgi:hypothetical protein
MSDLRYRVKNMCRYDIGVTLPNGVSVLIPAGGFQLLTADDIAYIEGICMVDKFFSKRMLVPFNSKNEEVKLEDVGMIPMEDETKHLTDEEITAMLKGTAKKLEAALNSVDNPAELHAIAEMAIKLDLPASKMKLIEAKVPNMDLLEAN